ncbi:MAG: hypothetical protein HFJ75_09325 [Eggerthellaceae bacterium]|nr:hypothetical protein [Eggerthellaceae bacterium]
MGKKKDAKKEAKKLAKKARKLEKGSADKAARTCGCAKGGKKDGACSPSKAAKGRKGCKAAKMLRDSQVDLSAARCPCCGKHCPLSKPRCGKGRRLAAKMQERAA